MKILWYPDPALMQRAEEVEEIDGQLVETCQQMLKTMYEGGGLGLAGPQVGLASRVVVANLTGEPGSEIMVVNPVIVERQDIIEAEEGCLSFPGLFTRIARSAKVLVRAYDLDGKEVEFEADGLTARLWQHEVDHLEGVLIVKRMSPVRRLAAARKLRELERKFRQPSQ